jgi:hypothetical protein
VDPWLLVERGAAATVFACGAAAAWAAGMAETGSVQEESRAQEAVPEYGCGTRGGSLCRAAGNSDCRAVYGDRQSNHGSHYAVSTAIHLSWPNPPKHCLFKRMKLLPLYVLAGGHQHADSTQQSVPSFFFLRHSAQSRRDERREQSSVHDGGRPHTQRITQHTRRQTDTQATPPHKETQTRSDWQFLV